MHHPLEQVRDDGVQERGRRGGDFAVDVDDEEERFVDVRPELRRVVRRRDPAGRGDAVVDHRGELLGAGARVGFEEFGVDLAEDVLDGFGFLGDPEGEGGFEVGDQLRD